jgi:hypothetical protein
MIECPQTLTRRWVRWAVLITLFLALPTAGQHSPALDGHDPLAPAPKRNTRLHYFVLIPKPLNLYQRDKQRIDFEPTIIPYSGWRFVGADGSDQPWRKRLLRHNPHSTATGGIGESTRDVAQLDMVWQYPQPADFIIDTFILDEAQWQPKRQAMSGMGLIDCRSSVLHLDFESLQKLPRQLNLSMVYRYGAWQDVAKANTDTKLPVGDEHIKITYLGKPRPESPVVKSMLESGVYRLGIEEVPHRFELQTTRTEDAGRWIYQTAWKLMNEDEGEGFTDYDLDTGKDLYELADIKANEFKHALIKRIALGKTTLEQIDLSWLDEIDSRHFKQQRIEIHPEDRFAKAQPLDQAMQPMKADAPCLLDLDTLTVHKMPDPAPTGESLAKLNEALGIDLILYENRFDGLMALMVGCSAFTLQQDQWDQTPAQCIAHARTRSRRAHKTQWPLHQGNRAVLVTTSEGGMVLLRVTDNKKSEVGQPGYAKIEVRKLRTDAISQRKPR